MAAWTAVLLGIGLGLSLAAPPGPMNALIAREAGRHGTFAGVRVGLGAPVADTLFLALLIFGVGAWLDSPGWVRGAAAAGAALMTVFAYGAVAPAATAATPGHRPASFWVGFAAALSNPFQVAWWLSGGFVFLQAQGGWGIVGLLAGIFGWVVVFSYLVAHGAQRWSWFAAAVQVVSAALLLTFAVLLGAIALGILMV